MASIEHFLHPSTCPRTLSSFMHPHSLTLLIRTPEDTSRTRRFCNVCHDHVHGLMYRCEECDFDVHPICTQLPEYVRHVRDRHHRLRLQSSSHGCCAVCHGPCTSWRYSCGNCGFDIHFQCVEAPYYPPTLTQLAVRPSGVPPSESRSWTPTYGGYGHGHLFGTPPPHGGYHYTVSHAYTTPYNANNYVYRPQGSGASSSGLEIGNMMAAVVGRLRVGILSNVIFGMIENVDYSSLM